MTTYGFAIGQSYNRRRDIHVRFGGNRQGGISTPKATRVIFAFTGSTGAKHGYDDTWSPEGLFLFFGEGQEGDMKLTKGNKAIARHLVDGKDLLLFETKGKGEVRFRGPFQCTGYELKEGVDRSGESRMAIVFQLMPLDEVLTPQEDDQAISFFGDLSALRQAAYEAAAPAQRQLSSKESRASYFVRSRAVRLYVLARAEGACECCSRPAPFTTPTGTPYLEPHHIRRLTDGGPDDPRYVGAVCPNCHREIHLGAEGDRRNDALLQRVQGKEKTIARG